MSLLQGQVAWAETDLLNLSSYQEASTPLYGENVLVGQDETGGYASLNPPYLDRIFQTQVLGFLNLPGLVR